MCIILRLLFTSWTSYCSWWEASALRRIFGHFVLEGLFCLFVFVLNKPRRQSKHTLLNKVSNWRFTGIEDFFSGNSLRWHNYHLVELFSQTQWNLHYHSYSAAQYFYKWFLITWHNMFFAVFKKLCYRIRYHHLGNNSDHNYHFKLH